MKLVIVESPTKAKTITKFLGKEYTVESSYGHVRDLPKSKMGVDIEKKFKPTYEVPKRAEDQVRMLKKLAKQADEIFLAPDEDREGEAIAWHLYETLNIKEKSVKRITFHEITKEAILEALENPRDIDNRLVNAQQARRIVDRLVGYELSPFLWTRVHYGLSAGRVQSVAMRMIVERERERQAFDKEEYWTIDTEFSKDKLTFEGKLHSAHGKKLDKLAIGDEEAAQKILNAVKDGPFTVTGTKKTTVSKKPPKPLTTSTLQIEANNQLSFSAKQTMTLAQKLYETGKITYMRTDSLNLSEQFLNATQAYLKGQHGAEYATGIKKYTTSSKGAQEAHEAIRPTNVANSPSKMKFRDKGQEKLYRLIWSRTVASQMPEAKVERTTIDITSNDYLFRSSGSTVVFDGYMKVYKSSADKILPALAEGDAVIAEKIEPTQHFTEPPARFSDATLVKSLEEHGIGRPSTYAPTISTIIDRGYIERDDNKKLYPLDVAFIVNDLLVEHFPNAVDYEFTAKLEKDLDDIADGGKEWVPVLEEFYTPFHKNLLAKEKEVKKEDVMKEREVGKDPETGMMIFAKNGRFGPFVQLGPWSDEDRKAKINKPKSASLEKGQTIDTVTLEDTQYLLIIPRVVGKYKDEDIVADIGRFGPYLKAGEISASLNGTKEKEDGDPRTITLEECTTILEEAEARKILLETPIQEFGEDPTTKGKIQVRHGRYGPYVTDGETNASITKKSGLDPEKITEKEAIALLVAKRKQPKRNFPGNGRR